jgi:hypothetical protein
MPGLQQLSVKMLPSLQGAMPPPLSRRTEDRCDQRSFAWLDGTEWSRSASADWSRLLDDDCGRKATVFEVR